MDIKDYDIMEIEFGEFSIKCPKNIFEKVQVEKIEQLIESKYNPEDEYNVYIVINRDLAEKFWKEEGLKKFKRNIN